VRRNSAAATTLTGATARKPRSRPEEIDKHLEQIYARPGVENRTAAAAGIAAREPAQFVN